MRRRQRVLGRGDDGARKPALRNLGAHVHRAPARARSRLPIVLLDGGLERLDAVLELEDLGHNVRRLAHAPNLVVELANLAADALACLPYAVDAADEPVCDIRIAVINLLEAEAARRERR